MVWYRQVMAELGPCLLQPGARWSQFHRMSHMLPPVLALSVPCGFNANVTPWDPFLVGLYLFIYF